MHFLSVWWQIKKITIFKKRKLGSVLRKLPESNCWLHFVCYPFDDIYIGVLYSSWHIPRGSQELYEMVDIDYFLPVNNNAQALTHTVLYFLHLQINSEQFFSSEKPIAHRLILQFWSSIKNTFRDILSFSPYKCKNRRCGGSLVE